MQQEAFQGTILQQVFEVEYVVASLQCHDCAKSFTPNTWRAVVQVRQKVPHKRTFLYLEQLILKHGAHRDATSMKEAKDGLDFYFSQRNHAEKFVDFLSCVAPVKSKKSQELISMDVHTSTRSYKFTFSVELVPVCKDDLVALPIKMAQMIGNISPLTLCYRVGTTLNVMDPTTLQTADISTSVYWRTPFRSLADVQELVEFIVMDIDPVGPSKGRFLLAEATVARASDLGSNNMTYFVRTHLGGILHTGDSVLGYHLSGTNFNNPHFEALEKSNVHASRIPDVILVKKHYARKKKNNKSSKSARNWRLKRLGGQHEGEDDAQQQQQQQQQARRQQEQDRVERDYELFLRDIEEDADLRSTLALYKAPTRDTGRRKPEKMDGVETTNVATTTTGEADAKDEDDDDDDDDGDDIPPINVDDLLDEFDEMHMDDRSK